MSQVPDFGDLSDVQFEVDQLGFDLDGFEMPEQFDQPPSGGGEFNVEGVDLSKLEFGSSDQQNVASDLNFSGLDLGPPPDLDFGAPPD
eukprot:CAMPEP_0201490898 /NCGR_PEP_ID=MMETSP0151_2-20130828/27865_1 /ASSEMBLY_ACC=CAM_ASM_000257 /TAXON_ID=200890 /ORGANISM="Paramoeba atlantica, Strain 621/1 / CCAP 1560/9" /LENGTH=87 /DNA_ID=CAMNT_0047877035 /DNA_START=19 /DNA_END=279 /DNA_ORIENTATION=+